MTDLPPPPTCRACQIGACDDCDGSAWDDLINFPHPCRCWTDNHEGDTP